MWYLALTDGPVRRTVHLSDEVAVDVDERETVIGVEFLSALTAIAPDVRKALFERFPVVREALVKLHAAVA